MNPADTAPRTRALLRQALDVYRDSPRATAWLHRHLARFDDSLRLAVLGHRGVGKSTLINAIVGDEVAPVTTGGIPVVSCYRGAAEPQAVGYTPGAAARELPVERLGSRLRLDLDAAGEQLQRVDVGWPSRSLRELTLIDTPGLDEETPAYAVRGWCADADAVLGLVRGPRSTELDVMRTVHAHPPAPAVPVHALLVLSRADELGGGRSDGLISGRQVARRWRREPEVREVCQDVVAMCGQVAVAGRTVDEGEFAALCTLAELPRPDLEAQLLSTQRFARSDSPLPVPHAVRERLLERFGLFGVRMASALVRHGAATPASLTAQLVQRSGLTELRESIERHFLRRAPDLKARAALLGLDALLRREPRRGSAELGAELDRVLAGAHEFRELSLLATLQTDRDVLPEPLREEAERLVGGCGTTVTERLGLAGQQGPTGQSVAESFQVIEDARRRWQERANDRALGVAARRAATVVVRSCEGMAMSLGHDGPASE